MRDIVIDASCLIDVRKGGLLVALRDLGYRLVMPLRSGFRRFWTSQGNIGAIWTMGA